MMRRKLVPYLKALGISHLYASPFLKARSGSTHGYDIIDHNALNPEFGGEDAFLRLSAALTQADIGLILDFVPNHMGVHYADNAWWLDVLEWGPKSPCALSSTSTGKRCRRGRSGVCSFRFSAGLTARRWKTARSSFATTPREGSFSAWYFEHQLPIGPNRYGEILEKSSRRRALRRKPPAAGCSKSPPVTAGRTIPRASDGAGLKAEIAAIAGSQEVIERGLKAYQPKSGEPGRATRAASSVGTTALSRGALAARWQRYQLSALLRYQFAGRAAG